VLEPIHGIQQKLAQFGFIFGTRHGTTAVVVIVVIGNQEEEV
jgi:hypothetical protein